MIQHSLSTSRPKSANWFADTLRHNKQRWDSRGNGNSTDSSFFHKDRSQPVRSITAKQYPDSSVIKKSSDSGPADRHRATGESIADKIAVPMFLLSLLFLSLIAALMVLGLAAEANAPAGPVDEVLAYNPVNAATTAVSSIPGEGGDKRKLSGILVNLLLIVWPVFWIEHLFSVFKTRTRRSFRRVLGDMLVCFMPPLRLASPSLLNNGQLWLPILGWNLPGRKLHRRLDRTLSKPMLFIGLLILPILLVESSLSTWIADSSALFLLLHSATAFIWFAFSVEFILMVNTTEKKLAYVKSHWIELAIIILPLVSFLRTLRILRVSQAVRLQKMAKMAKTYRMRGVIGRTVRALSLLEVGSRLRRENPQVKLLRLAELRNEKLIELDELQMQIGELENHIVHSGEQLPASELVTSARSQAHAEDQMASNGLSGWRSAA